MKFWSRMSDPTVATDFFLVDQFVLNNKKIYICHAKKYGVPSSRTKNFVRQAQLSIEGVGVAKCLFYP